MLRSKHIEGVPSIEGELSPGLVNLKKGLLKPTPVSKGASSLIASLQSECSQNQSAFHAVAQILTLGNRIPFDQAFKSLTAFGQMAITTMESNPQLRLECHDPQAAPSPNSLFVVQDHIIGHVSILAPSDIALSRLTGRQVVVGTVQFPADEYASLEAYRISSEQRFLEQTRQAAAELSVMEEEGTLPTVVANVRDNLMRIGPTFTYVENQLYSTFDRVGKNVVDRNTYGGGRVLTVLSYQPVNTWRSEDQMYVYVTHLLLESAGPARIEEFNGGQLNLDNLQTFFNGKVTLYGNTLGEEVPSEWDTFTLQQKAKFIKQQFERVNSSHQRYRIINGLNLRQEEGILGVKRSPFEHGIQTDLAERVATVFGIEPSRGEGAERFWQRVTQDVIQREVTLREALAEQATAEGTVPLPLLIWSIIGAASDATNSDIAMSSTFRDASKFLKEGALSLKDVHDFYCCVVPSAAMARFHTDEQLAVVLEIIARRMEFNRWHFLPRNMPREEIPLTRDWFFPPAIPDIATETDLHHGGHIEAGVKRSVRYPASIFVGGWEYKGAYDIRLMRQNGALYTSDDIHTARRYLDPLGIVLQGVLSYAEIHPEQSLKMEAFSMAWYRNHEWKKYMEAIGSGNHPGQL